MTQKKGNFFFYLPEVFSHLCFIVRCSKIDDKPPNVSYCGKKYRPSIFFVTVDGNQFSSLNTKFKI
jgi:hypothetical protein